MIKNVVHVKLTAKLAGDIAVSEPASVAMALVYWEDEVVAPTVPFDVTFLVEEEGREVGEVAAHRLVLGLSSPVLRAQLCSAAWPDGAAGRRVRVADVTWRALRATVDYLYGKPLRQGELDTLGFEEAAFLLEVRLVEPG